MHLRKTFTFLSAILIGSASVAQLDYNAVKFDYKSLNPTFDAVARKIGKPEKVFIKYNERFQFNYPAEIQNAAGGYLYRGNIYCKWVNSPAEADSFTLQVNFGNLNVMRTLRDEIVRVSLDVNGVLRHYHVAYPVEVLVYKKGELVKQVSFFTEERPLEFTFSKEMTDPSINTYNVAFASATEINEHETAGKVRKAAEKFAYFTAMQKVHEVLKNLYGDYSYEFEIGYLSIKPKKAAADYTDVINSTATLEQAIVAFKKNNLVLRDSLAKKAQREFAGYAAATDERMTPVAKEVVNYNLMVSHALAGDVDKALEMLKTHRQTKMQERETFSGNSIGMFLEVMKLRQRLQAESKILL